MAFTRRTRPSSFGSFIFFAMIICISLTAPESRADKIRTYLNRLGDASISECAFVLTQSISYRLGKFIPWDRVSFRQKIELKTVWAKIQPTRALPLSQEFKKWKAEHPVYISVTTSPKRIRYLNYTLSTLDLRNVEKVFVSLPEKFGRTDESYVIPEALFNHPKIQLLRPSVDEGPASKILTAIDYLNLHSPNALLISIDDDMAYAKGMVHELILAAYQNPSAVLGGGGFRYEENKFPISGTLFSQSKSTQAFQSLRQQFSPLDILEGYAGIIYPVKQVPVDLIRRNSRACPECFVSDDLTIAMALDESKVPRYHVSSTYFNLEGVSHLPQGDEIDALRLGAGKKDTEGKTIHPENYAKAYREILPLMKQYR